MSVLVDNEFGQVQQINITNQVAALVIAHKTCQAKVSLYGGQVLSWQPLGQQEVFWLSKTASFEQGKAIRGGIPLCWPWFGAHPNDNENKAGNHGFARGQVWQVSKVIVSENQVEITLSFEGENMHSLWPYACKLEQKLTFSTQFTQTLTMTNLSEKEASYSAALHSYFRVSTPKSITINALNHADFDDKLTGQYCPAQALANGVGPIDRIYHTNQTMQLVDSDWQRIIDVSVENTRQWVFWNPGAELASNMVDIHAQGEQEFVCLEAANTTMQQLAAGESQTISQTIQVIPNAQPLDYDH